MQHYKIRQDGFKEITKQMLIRTLPMMLIAITIGITISTINSKDKSDLVNVLPIIIPLLTVAAIFGVYRGVNRQRGLFESYQLTFTNNVITREQHKTPTVSIYFNDITEIVKNKNGSFIVKGKDPMDVIAIPAQIENYLELENKLTQIKQISTNSNKNFLLRNGIAVTILTLGLMLCVYTVTNKIVVAIIGTILLGILTWSFYQVRTSKNVDAKTKRSMWWVLIVFASIIGVMIMKLFGLQKA